MAVGDAAIGVIGIFGLLFWLFILVMILFSIASMVFWVVMLIDAIKRDFPGANDKLLWILILVFAGAIGAVIYYFMVKRKSDRNETMPQPAEPMPKKAKTRAN